MDDLHIVETTVDPGRRRPLLVVTLAVLWLVAAVLFSVLAIKTYFETGVILPGGILVSVISGLLAYGLWTGRPWARILQVIVFVPMMCVMPVGFAAIILLGYMTRPETKGYFVPLPGGPTWEARGRWTRSEWPWIASAAAAIVAGAALLMAMAPLFRAWR